MPYALTILVQLGVDGAGKVLACDLRDTQGNFVEPDIVDGFVELGNGDYMWTGLIPDGFQGAVVFNDNADGSYQCATAINPQEFENADVKTSTVLAKVSTAVVNVVSPVLEAGRIDLIRGDDYLVVNGRQLELSPEDPDAWPVLPEGYPVVLGVGNGHGIEFQGEGAIGAGTPPVAIIEIKGDDTRDAAAGHLRFTLRTSGDTIETLAEGVLNLHNAWGGY